MRVGLKFVWTVLLLTLLLLLCSYALVSSYLEVKTEAIMQLQERQATHARQAALNIQNFFENHLFQLKNLGVSEHIVNLDEQGKELMGLYYLSHWEQVISVGRVDEKGRMIYVVPQSAAELGTDLSGRQDIQEVKWTHQPVVSEVFAARSGLHTVACQIPVFERGSYRGTLGISVPFGYLAKKFLADIRIGEEGYAWLISGKGIELYGPVPGYVGTSVFETYRDYPSILSTAKEMIRGRSGTASYQYDRNRTQTVAMQTKRAVYMPIPLAGTFWSIAVVAPEKEVLASIEGFRNSWMLVMVTLVSFGVLGAYHLLRAAWIIREDDKRRQMEAALRESEIRYRAIVEEQSELIVRFADDRTLLYVNDACCRFFGENRENLLRGEFWRHVLPDDQDQLQAQFASLSVESPVFRIEHSVVAGNGENRWLQWVAHGIFDKSGKLVEIQAVGRDTTDQKRTEEALQTAHRRLFEIIDFLPDPTFVIDQDRRVIAWNRAIEELTGVEAETMLGRGDYEYALPFYGVRRPLLIDMVFLTETEVEGRYSPLRREGSVVIGEARIPSFRGREVVLWGKASPIYDEKGGLAGAIESIRDITDAKRVESALRESERRFREILENIELAAVIMDKEGRATFCNGFLLEVTGWERQQVLGSNLIEYLVAEEDRAEMRLVVEEMIGTGKAFSHFENDIVTRAGGRRTIRWSNTILRDSTGEIQGVTAIGEDITDRKQLERQLLQAQKMEAIGTLAGGIAHDFNNILAAILGYTELSLLEVHEATTLHGHLRQIMRSSTRARDLVRQILAFSRQQLEQEPVPVDIRPVFEDTLKFLRATLPATIEIRAHATAQPLVIQINPTQWHQIVVNLAANAAHAMRERGGVLDLSLDRITLGVAKVFQQWELPPGAYVRLTVSDTGHGIDGITMERIFDPYFTTKPVGEGSGLGLSIVHGVVTRHGGAVGVESEPGKGARFEVYLPEAESTPLDLDEPEVWTRVAGGTERILIVDDEAPLVDLLTQNLSLLGYSVTGTTNSEEALDAVLANPKQFDLVLTDLTMPHLTGPELAQQIHAANADLPIILCTGFSESISEEEARVLGIRALMFKPCTRNDLAKTVRAVLDGEVGTAISDYHRPGGSL